MMHVDLKVGESIKVGDAVLKLVIKSGQVVRLSIDADKTIPIQRVNNEKPNSLIAKDYN